jgi:hypothetical protein
MTHEEFIIRNNQIVHYALSNPSAKLTDLSLQFNLSGSQIADILASSGVRKQKGIGKLWSHGKVRKREYPKVLVRKQRQKSPNALINNPLYRVYRNMIERCGNLKNKNYGGRGITVCEQWKGKEGFIHFTQDMGPRPNGKTESGKRVAYTIERRDNNLGYSSDNCYWATYKAQNNNQRTKACGATLDQEKANQIRRLYKSGKTQKDISKELGYSPGLICYVVNNRIWKDPNYEVPPTHPKRIT